LASEESYTALLVDAYNLTQHIDGGRADGILGRHSQTYLRPNLLV